MTPPQKKEDRRIQRTRQLLREALLALIVERGYDNITVQDITDRANVARTTFYLHYKDKDELLFAGMREIYDGLIAQADLRNRNPFLGMPLNDASDFLHVAEYANFYRVMLNEKGSMSFLVRVWEYLADAIFKDLLHESLQQARATSQLPAEALAAYVAGAQVGLLRWWLNHNMTIPAEEMAKLCEDITMKGMLSVLGLPEGKTMP